MATFQPREGHIVGRESAMNCYEGDRHLCVAFASLLHLLVEEELGSVV